MAQNIELTRELNIPHVASSPENMSKHDEEVLLPGPSPLTGSQWWQIFAASVCFFNTW